MTAPNPPDTTAIRAFAAGMRTSVGIRNELLTAQSHLLALCDALDAERAADAPKPPPKRASDREDGPLSDNNCAFLRENYGGAGGLSVYWGGRLFATLDAERAANAEMRKALGVAEAARDEFLAKKRDVSEKLSAAIRERAAAMATVGAAAVAYRDVQHEAKRYRDALEEINGWAFYDEVSHDEMQEIVRSALRAAEKAPETTEPAPPAGDGLTVDTRDADDFAKYIADGELPGKDHACARCVPYESGTIQDFVCVRHRALDRVRAAAEKASTR